MDKQIQPCLNYKKQIQSEYDMKLIDEMFDVFGFTNLFKKTNNFSKKHTKRKEENRKKDKELKAKARKRRR